MRKFVGMLSALAVVGLAACTESAMAPGDINRELVDGHGTRIETPNVLIYARFGFTEGGTVSVLDYVGAGLNEEGKEIGWCTGGVWQNPSNKKNASAFPHAHCVRAAGASQQDIVALEEISGKRETPSGNVTHKLIFGNEGEVDENNKSIELRVQYQSSQNRTQGQGLVVAHALKNGVQHGKFVFDLAQFSIDGSNLLAGECEFDDMPESVMCLSHMVDDALEGAATAYYFADVDADHSDLSNADRIVSGFIYWIDLD